MQRGRSPPTHGCKCANNIWLSEDFRYYRYVNQPSTERGPLPFSEGREVCELVYFRLYDHRYLLLLCQAPNSASA